MRFVRITIISYFVVVLGLFLYSFTQIDLGLTLSRISIWQGIQKWFQHIGYFQRPLSADLYLIILGLLFVFYFIFLYFVSKKLITQKQIWIVIIATSVVLTFSYNAFSYDLFNYIFDAKIFTFYHQNPYLHEALNYPHDPMLGFMHWTNRTYPYGPTWLVLTIPLSFLGFKVFGITFYMFKMLAGASFLGSVYYIGKILKRISPKNETYGLVFFALNPLSLIESLVSAHNDIPMMFFALLAVYLAINRKWILGLILLIFSALIKNVTAVLILPYILYILSNTYIKKIRLSTENFFRLCIVFLIAGFIYVLTKLQIQPWYLLWILPFLALIKLKNKYNKYLVALTAGFCLGLLLRYALFLYEGNWNGFVLPLDTLLTLITPIVFVLAVFIYDMGFAFRKKIDN